MMSDVDDVIVAFARRVERKMRRGRDEHGPFADRIMMNAGG